MVASGLIPFMIWGGVIATIRYQRHRGLEIMDPFLVTVLVFLFGGAFAFWGVAKGLQLWLTERDTFYGGTIFVPAIFLTMLIGCVILY